MKVERTRYTNQNLNGYLATIWDLTSSPPGCSALLLSVGSGLRKPELIPDLVAVTPIKADCRRGLIRWVALPTVNSTTDGNGLGENDEILYVRGTSTGTSRGNHERLARGKV